MQRNKEWLDVKPMKNVLRKEAMGSIKGVTMSYNLIGLKNSSFIEIIECLRRQLANFTNRSISLIKTAILISKVKRFKWIWN